MDPADNFAGFIESLRNLNILVQLHRILEKQRESDVTGTALIRSPIVDAG